MIDVQRRPTAPLVSAVNILLQALRRQSRRRAVAIYLDYGIEMILATLVAKILIAHTAAA